MKFLLPIILQLLSILLLLSSCKQASVQNDNSIECFPKDWSEEAIDISNYIDDFEIISLETNEDCIIALVGQIAKIDDYLVVFDKLGRKVLAFDFKGKFSHNIGNKGNGPGEYINPIGFITTTDNSELVINVMQEKSLMYYSPKGAFLEEHKLPMRGHRIAFINDTLIGIHSGRMGYNGTSETYFDLWITNKEGVVIDKLFKYNEALSMDYGCNFMPSFEDGSVLYTRMADYSIYRISGNSVDTLYRFDFGSANLDTAYYLRAENFSKVRTLSGKIQSFSTVTNTKSDLLASFLMPGETAPMILVNNLTGNNKYIPLDSTGMGYYFGVPVPIARWADETHRYSVIPAYLWRTVMDDLSHEQKEICRNKITGFQRSEGAMEDDNPIVIRFKFKDF